MRKRTFKAPPRKTQRRWRVPPALTHGDDAFEGLSVLEEVPGEKGLVLWQSLRDALLWGQTRPEARSDLFAAGAEPARVAAILASGLPPEAEEPLRTIAHMLGATDTAREENVSLACRQVSLWADERGTMATSLAFAQAAAVVTPGDPATSFAVAKLARRRAENARAETWYRRTIALARQAGDWPTYALAFLGLGTLYVQRGNYPAARRFYTRALRAAGRNSLHDVSGSALHDLFSIAVETGETANAHELARSALEAYGPAHPSLPRLAKDVAAFWTTQGSFSRSLPVLQQLLPLFRRPSDRLLVLADVGRAAGGLGRRDLFQQAWDESWEIMHAGGVDDSAARSLLDLAHGAASLGVWERAERAAQASLEIATRRNEGKVRLTAEAVLDSARHHRIAEQRIAAPEDATADSLADEFVRSLSLCESVG
jgi:tetratricopeptide (TPR) repeat protein